MLDALRLGLSQRDHGVVEIHVRPIQLLHLTEAHPRERSNGVPRFTSTEAANGKKTPELIVSQGAPNMANIHSFILLRDL
jgi:hypothetical protein